MHANFHCLNGHSHAIADIARFGSVRMARDVSLGLGHYPDASKRVACIAAPPAVLRALVRCGA